MVRTTKNEIEVRKFAELADQWWDEAGSFKPLHKINPVRLKYINEVIAKLKPGMGRSDISILDVGCGGGLVSIPLARSGYKVTAIDAASENIGIASYKAQELGVEVNFHTLTAEELVALGEKFDVVISLEVIEHVDEVPLFVESLARLVRVGGVIVVSTLNKTLKSLMLAKVAAEYVLNIVPRGTHDWNKFVDPDDLALLFKKNGCVVVDKAGLELKILTNEWCLSDDLAVNYFISAIKK